jgi:hypothetical protein
MPSRLALVPAALALAGLVFVTAGCDEKLSTVTGPSPNLQPTFASISKEIFETTDSAGRQACISCHTNIGRTPASGLNLAAGAAYAALVGVGSVGKPGAKLVVPGDPDASYLVQKLEGDPGIVGKRMPRNGPPYLTSGQMLVIRRWIELGARND